jgi:TolB-like protein
VLKLIESKKTKHIQIVIIALLLSVLVSLAHAAPSRVAILPFDINAERDMTFLQEGIVDMLASRIAWKDKVEIISETKTKSVLASVEDSDSESRALTVGEKLGADYVLFGSLTVFGESVSIDAKMADVSGQAPPLPFFAQTQGMSAVIPQINQFAANINETVFGRGTAPRSVAVAPATPKASAPAPQAPQAAQPHDPRMHPEKLLQSGVVAKTPAPAASQAAPDPGQVPNPAFVTAAPAAKAGTFWKSRNFKSLITGLDVADVDADGRNELIVVSDKLVAIYRIENGRTVKIAEAASTRQSAFISVDTADINGNGTPEIYVTSLGSSNTKVDSIVLEYDGNTYQTISDGDNWFYRVGQTADQGDVLLGQRQRFGAESIFKDPIHKMRWEGDRLVAAQQILPGGKANLMGLAYGDITHTGNSVAAAYSDQDRVRLYNSGGGMTWEEAERSGGNMIFFSLAKDEPGNPNRQYFPLRIRLTDIDRDGKTEVMIARHEDLAKSMLQDFRSLKNAKVESLEWNQLGLAPKWETQALSGRVSDFTVGDLDNNGVDELVIALVAKEGKVLFTDSVSSVIAFDLNVQ